MSSYYECKQIAKNAADNKQGIFTNYFIILQQESVYNKYAYWLGTSQSDYKIKQYTFS